MMGWIIISVLAVAVLAAMILIVRIPRASWEFVAAALILGITGYTWQGNPGYAGAPKSAEAGFTSADADLEMAMINLRSEMGERFTKGKSWLVLADSQSRRGNYASAATILGNGTKDFPEDINLWVALGNALVGQADGVMTPAAQFAYDRAKKIDPKHPGAPFFSGLALARGGKLEDAKAEWDDLLTRTTAEDAWYGPLMISLSRVDQLLGNSETVTVPASSGENNGDDNRDIQETTQPASGGE